MMPIGFVKYYTDDATAILPGSLRGSRKVIRDLMAAGFEGPLKGSSTVDKQLGLRFVGQDAAIAISEGGLLFAGENTVPEARRSTRPGCSRNAMAGGWSRRTTTALCRHRFTPDTAPGVRDPRAIPGPRHGPGVAGDSGATPPSWRGIRWCR